MPYHSDENLFSKRSGSKQNLLLILLLLLAALYTLHFAQEILIPLAVALLLQFVLIPLHDRLVRIRVPPILSAALLLGLLCGGIVYGGIYLYEPARDWMRKMPGTVTVLEEKLHTLFVTVKEVSKMAESVDTITEVDEEEGSIEIKVQEEGKEDGIWIQAGALLSGATTVFILLFFMLAFSGPLQEKLAYRHEATYRLFSQIRTHISAYMITITCINFGLGLCVGLAMLFLGMPNPVLWGFMAALFNYVPYLGAVVGSAIVMLAAIVTFDDLGHAFMAPIAYFSLSALEGAFLTPIILGRQFVINPILIILWVFFWGWIWGVPGALMAMPFLMAFNIVCKNIEGLNWISRLMGR